MCITVTVLIENTCFLQTWYTIPKEQRIQVYTDPRKQHIAYTIFYGCVHAKGVEQFIVCVYIQLQGKSAFTSAQDPLHKRHATDTPTEGVHLERKYQNPHPHTPHQHPNPWSFITFFITLAIIVYIFSTGSAHLPIQDRSDTLYPKHRKGNIHHIYRDSTCTPPLCAPD